MQCVRSMLAPNADSEMWVGYFRFCFRVIVRLFGGRQSEDADPVELPVPEQFETKIRDGHLITTAISHVGA
jgi:hypothetical protein